MTYEITVEQVEARIRELATEYPHATYSPPAGDEAACSYTRGELAGRAGCLLGQVLTDLGVSTVDLALVDNEGIAFAVPVLLGLDAPEAWEAAQDANDRGDTLTEVVKKMDELA